MHLVKSLYIIYMPRIEEENRDHKPDHIFSSDGGVPCTKFHPVTATRNTALNFVYLFTRRTEGVISDSLNLCLSCVSPNFCLILYPDLSMPATLQESTFSSKLFLVSIFSPSYITINASFSLKAYFNYFSSLITSNTASETQLRNY